MRELAGFEPVVGLYASILPLVAYAIFGTSRQLIVGPDAATCAMIAAAVAPLAGGDQTTLRWLVTIALTFTAGLFCIGASFLRLGALADFLSRPILVGYLAGIALTIILGQIGKVTGVTLEAGRHRPSADRARTETRARPLAYRRWRPARSSSSCSRRSCLDGCPPRCWH